MSDNDKIEEVLKYIECNPDGRNFKTGFFKYLDCEGYKELNINSLRFCTDYSGNPNDTEEKNPGAYSEKDAIILRCPISYFKKENIAMWGVYAPSGICINFPKSTILGIKGKGKKEGKYRSFSICRGNGQESVKLNRDDVSFDYRFMVYTNDRNQEHDNEVFVMRGNHTAVIDNSRLEKLRENNPTKDISWSFEVELRLYARVKKDAIERLFGDPEAFDERSGYGTLEFDGDGIKAYRTPFKGDLIDPHLKKLGVSYETSILAGTTNINAYYLNPGKKDSDSSK